MNKNTAKDTIRGVHTPLTLNLILLKKFGLQLLVQTAKFIFKQISYNLRNHMTFHHDYTVNECLKRNKYQKEQSLIKIDLQQYFIDKKKKNYRYIFSVLLFLSTYILYIICVYMYIHILIK